MMDILAAVVVIATFAFIIRGAEVRLALLAGGAVLALAAWKPEAWFGSFAASIADFASALRVRSSAWRTLSSSAA